MTMFDAAHATIDRLIDRTVAQLEAHRAAGGDDDSFQAALVGQFYTAAAHMPPTAGAAHMAIALYRLATNHQRIAGLIAENTLYANTLYDLDALEGL